MGAKIKTKKIPGPKINPQKIPCFGCTLLAELRSWDMWVLPQIFRLFCIPEKFPS